MALKYGWSHQGNVYISPGGFSTTRTGYRNDVVNREKGWDSEKQMRRIESGNTWPGRIVDAKSAYQALNYEGRDKDRKTIQAIAALDRAQQAAGRVKNTHGGRTGQFKGYKVTNQTKQAMRQVLIALNRIDANDKRAGTDY